MSMSDNDDQGMSQDESTYFIDAENAAEMARLMRQDRFITKNMGGLFPERPELAVSKRILDIACGPGGWAFDVARANPGAAVVGIDISQLMVEYARAWGHAHDIPNASFRVMNAMKPLDFPDNLFDLVNARFMLAFMTAEAWPRLVQECMRITRSGGVIRLTDFDVYGVTNSPAFEQITDWGSRAFKIAGQSFSPDGRGVGLTPMLGRFLRNAGCINVHSMAHALEFSYGTEGHMVMYENSRAVFKLMQPFLVKTGIATQKELDHTYDQMLKEMMEENFNGIWFYLTASGEKPE